MVSDSSDSTSALDATLTVLSLEIVIHAVMFKCRGLFS